MPSGRRFDGKSGHSINPLCQELWNLNAHCERWIRSVKSEVFSKMILFGERSLRHCLRNYVCHYHRERNHQGKGNVVLSPEPDDRVGASSGEIRSRERLGGLLKFYYREAA